METFLPKSRCITSRHIQLFKAIPSVQFHGSRPGPLAPDQWTAGGQGQLRNGMIPPPFLRNPTWKNVSQFWLSGKKCVLRRRLSWGIIFNIRKATGTCKGCESTSVLANWSSGRPTSHQQVDEWQPQFSRHPPLVTCLGWKIHHAMGWCISWLKMGDVQDIPKWDLCLWHFSSRKSKARLGTEHHSGTLGAINSLEHLMMIRIA